MTTMTTPAQAPPATTTQKVGLALAGLLSLVNIASVVGPAPEGEVGPPAVVLWAGTVLGVVGLVAVIVAWRTGSRSALRVAAGALVVTALTAVPALFVDVPAFIKVFVAITVLASVAAVVLMFSSSRRPAPVND